MVCSKVQLHLLLRRSNQCTKLHSLLTLMTQRLHPASLCIFGRVMSFMYFSCWYELACFQSVYHFPTAWPCLQQTLIHLANFISSLSSSSSAGWSQSIQSLLSKCMNEPWPPPPSQVHFLPETSFGWYWALHTWNYEAPSVYVIISKLSVCRQNHVLLLLSCLISCFKNSTKPL